jgi:3-oxoacyl-[acyl-carrier-protein] synthase II
MKAFIHSMALVSPLPTFGNGLPAEISGTEGKPFLKSLDPPYREYIDPMVARRMSRIVKMGMCAALNCLRNSDREVPDAVIAGTGLGCLEDTEKFLGSIYTLNEHLLNPTPFINSTHNTIAGAIALAIKCHGYNSTYSHRGFSFESAIRDAMMLLAEHPEWHILAGAFDEITPSSFEITRRLGLWRKPGTVAGEGVAFFLLSAEKEKALGMLRGLMTLTNPQRTGEIISAAAQFLKDENTDPLSIDLVLAGMHGNEGPDRWYGALKNELFPGTPFSGYKHLCGEYDTSAAFALGMALNLMRSGKAPEWLLPGKKQPEKIRNILIYNHQLGQRHSFYLVSAC